MARRCEMANDVMLRTEHAEAVKRARDAIRAAFAVVGRDDSRREERTKVAADLVKATEDLAWLAALEPAEWAAAAAALATGAQFAEHARQVKAAVKAAAKAKHRAILDEQRRMAGPQPSTTRSASPAVEAFIPRATPSVMVQLDRKIRMVDGVPEPGPPKPCLSNLAIILSEDPHCKGKIRYNAFSCMVEVEGIDKTDDLDTHIAIAIHRAYDLEAPTEKVREALGYVAKRYGSYDPLVEYLDGLTWDGVPRIATMLQDLFAVEVPRLVDPATQDEVSAPNLLASIARCMMVGLVARAYEPGCKLDTMPVFVGLGGKGKSRGIAALCPRPEWFCDTQLDLRDKDRFQALDGVWIYENAEMDTLSNAALTRIKGFSSSAADKYRRPYDRTPQRHKRRTGFLGSTNDPEFGKDRRFHPIDVSDKAKVNPERIAALRDQLWAEARTLYRSGTPWHLSDIQAGRLEQHAEKYRVVHPWEPNIVLFLENKDKAREQADIGFHVSDVLGWLGVPVEKRTDTRMVMAVTKILNERGCKKHRPRTLGSRATMWFRPDAPGLFPVVAPPVVAGAEDDGGPVF